MLVGATAQVVQFNPPKGFNRQKRSANTGILLAAKKTAKSLILLGSSFYWRIGSVFKQSRLKRQQIVAELSVISTCNCQKK